MTSPFDLLYWNQLLVGCSPNGFVCASSNFAFFAYDQFPVNQEVSHT